MGRSEVGRGALKLLPCRTKNGLIYSEVGFFNNNLR